MPFTFDEVFYLKWIVFYIIWSAVRNRFSFWVFWVGERRIWIHVTKRKIGDKRTNLQHLILQQPHTQSAITCEKHQNLGARNMKMGLTVGWLLAFSAPYDQSRTNTGLSARGILRILPREVSQDILTLISVFSSKDSIRLLIL